VGLGLTAAPPELEGLSCARRVPLARGGPWAPPRRVSWGRWLPRALTAGRRALPDFVILGAQRAGTTSLYEYLAAHPAVLPALVKEVHYFDEHAGRPEAWYRAHFPLRAELARRGALTGEGSPYYLFQPDGPERLAAALPAARFLVLLRNPVDRAFSHYRMNVRNRVERLGFEEALAAEPRRLAAAAGLDPAAALLVRQRASYRARGRYAEQLARWRERVPPERLLVLQSEEFLRDTAGVMARVQDFLGLPSHRPAEYPRYHDSAGSGRTPARPAPETRARLLAEFAPHNERLFELLGEQWDWNA
jgi:hypothetical protein